MLVQCNGNGGIDARVFQDPATDYGAQDDKVCNSHNHWVTTAPAFAADYDIAGGPGKRCKIVETRANDKIMMVTGYKAYMPGEKATKQRAVVCKE
jgi:hypothetical protein